MSRTFRVFVSSTFGDLIAERNALHEHVFPALRQLCQERGTHFQPVDLRWGVRDEAGLDQQALAICLEELRRCQDTGLKPNFLILLGDRYGWRPLPHRIDASEFEALFGALDAPDRSALRRWYRRDDNARPAEYVLQSRRGEYEAPDRWEQQETILRSGFRRAMDRLGWSATNQRRRPFEDSATHQEITQGALLVDDAAQHVFCYQRQLDGLPDVADALVRPYADYLPDNRRDPDARERLERLKDDVAQRLPADHVYRYRADLSAWPDTAVLKEFGAQAHRDLAGVIEAELDRMDRLSAAGHEARAHGDFARDRSRSFLGRDRERDRVRAYLSGPETAPLAVHGRSGSGKTALLAQAANEADHRHVVVARFLGVTPAASTLRSLLESICGEIGEAQGDPAPVPAMLPELIADLPRRLARATAERPLVLFLDALDQLSPSDNAHALAWLPRRLPAHVKAVVSVLDEPGPAGACLAAVRQLVPADSLIALPDLTDEQGGQLLDTWLDEAGRTLQPGQRHTVLAGFAGCRLPLYLKLLVEEAKQWRSDDDPSLPGAHVAGLLQALFERLEAPARHGERLVRRGLGYLAAARHGLSEDELLDLLSADTEFFAEFLGRAHHALPGGVRRLPAVVWSRLYHDLRPYLSERQADDTVLLAFYHRQVAEAVECRYLAGTDRRHAHRCLADYFAAGPPRFGAAPNRRKLSEQPAQQTRGELWPELEATLTDPSFLEAKVEAGAVFDLSADLGNAVAALPLARLGRRQVRLLQDALRRDLHFLARHPSTLFQCLWNSCWWYDCTQAADYYEPPEGGWEMEGPPWRRPGPRLSALLERWRTAKEQVPGFLWLRALRPPALPLGHTPTTVLHTGGDMVMGLAVSPDGSRIVSGDSPAGVVRVWDSATGAELACFRGHLQSIWCVAFSPDGTRFATASADQTVRLWDSLTSAPLACFGTATTARFERNNHAWCVAFSPDQRHLVAGYDDRTIRVWEIATGREMRRLTGHLGGVFSVAVSPDGHSLASGSGNKNVRDFTLRLWDLDTGQQRVCLTDHEGDVCTVAFSPNGRLLASGSRDGTIRIREAATGRTLSVCRGPTAGVESVAWLPDSRRLASGGNDQIIRFWDASTGQSLSSLRGHHEFVTGVVVSPDGRFLVSGSSDRSLRIWHLGEGLGAHRLRGHTHAISGLCFSPDGRRLASASGDGLVLLWAANGCLESSFSLDLEGVACLAFSPDSRRLAGGCTDGRVYFWDVEGTARRTSLAGPGGAVLRLAYSPDGRRLALGTQHNLVEVLDAASGAHVASPNRAESGQAQAFDLRGGVWALAFSPDGQKVLAGGVNRTAWIWHLAQGRFVARVSDCGPGYLSNDERFEADVGRLPVGIYSGDPLVDRAYELARTDRRIWGLALSPDGKRLVVGASNMEEHHTVEAFDPDSRERLDLIHGIGDVAALAVPAEHPFQVVCNAVETVVATGQPRRAFAWYPATARRVAAHPDGRIWAIAEGNTFQVFELQGTFVPTSGPTGPEMADPFAAPPVPLAPPPAPPLAPGPPPSGPSLSTSDADFRRLMATGELIVKIVAIAVMLGCMGLGAWMISRGGTPPPEADSGEVRRLLGIGGPPFTNLAWSPDGEALLTCDRQGVCRLWALEGDTVTSNRPLLAVPLRASVHPTGIAWRRDGTQLATLANEHLAIWDRDGPAPLAKHYLPGARGLAWSSDGKHLAYAVEGSIVLWDVDRSAKRPFPDHQGGKVAGVEWQPGGKLLLSATEDGRWGLWAPARAALVRAVVASEEGLIVAHWHPRGDLLATGSAQGRLCIWNVAGKRVREPGKGQEPGAVVALCWAPDGQMLASAHDDSMVVLWDAVSGQRLAIARFPAPDKVFSLAWRPKSPSVAIGTRGMVYLWQVVGPPARQ